MTAETNRINQGRLFSGSCVALIATAVAFAVVGDIMGPLKEYFVLTNAQVGWIGGAALWGFAVSIFVFGPLCDALGMQLLLQLAFLGHFIGVIVMIFANGFTMLFVGALTIALGNGIIEAACNPLVATIYPDRKTEMLNKFHVWFPGGIVIGGVAAYLLRLAGVHSWQVRLAVILAPTLAYGVLFFGQRFPATERLQSGVSFGRMFGETLLRPLFLLLLFCMMMTASLELGPNRWIPAILTAGGIPGILVLVWISGLMAVLRFYAGPVVHKLSPTGILLASAAISGVGLMWLSYATVASMAFAAATVFAVGVCYFWPTMLGVVAERVPKGGALALALMGGTGMAVVGLITSPQMGRVADAHINDKLPAIETFACLQEAVRTLPSLKREPDTPAEDIEAAVESARQVLASSEAETLPYTTATALRSIISAAPETDTAEKAKSLLGPAENHGGRVAFRRVAPLSIILVIIFGGLYLNDRSRGGYKAEKIGEDSRQ